MTLKKNLALMGMTTAVRLGTGLLTFSVLARTLGPQSFGILALWLSVSALITIVSNYGFIPHVLREIGASPVSAELIINEGLTAKLILSVPIFLLSVFAAWIFDFQHTSIFLCLLAASISDCFAEFMNASLRARDRFEIETRIASGGAVSHAVIVCTLALTFKSIEMVAWGYFLSRALILTATLTAVTSYFSRPRLVSVRASIDRLHKAFSYAMDYALQSLFGQIDSVVLNHFLGPMAVGLYQAGMRIFQVGAQAASVFSNVFLPRAAKIYSSGSGFGSESNRIQVIFISTGVLFGIVIASCAEILVSLLLGPSYTAVVELLPLFGLLFFLRFSAAAWGIVLTASGHQTYRTICGLAYWGGILALAIWLVPAYGNTGWLLSLCVCTVLLVIGYAARARRCLEKFWSSVGLFVLGSVLFLPFVLR